jgi:hypothetical protein
MSATPSATTTKVTPLAPSDPAERDEPGDVDLAVGERTPAEAAERDEARAACPSRPRRPPRSAGGADGGGTVRPGRPEPSHAAWTTTRSAQPSTPAGAMSHEIIAPYPMNPRRMPGMLHGGPPGTGTRRPMPLPRRLIRARRRGAGRRGRPTAPPDRRMRREQRDASQGPEEDPEQGRAARGCRRACPCPCRARSAPRRRLTRSRGRPYGSARPAGCPSSRGSTGADELPA